MLTLAIATAAFYLIYYHLYSCYLIYINWSNFTSNLFVGLANLIILFLNAISVDLFWAWVVMIDCICSTIIISFSVIFFIKMRQVNHLLHKPSFTASHLHTFTRQHVLTLTHVIGGNGFYGYLMASYFLLVVPINTIVVTAILNGEFAPLAALFHTAIASFEYLVIIAFHLMAAAFSDRIHKCFPRLVYYATRAAAYKLNLRDRIRLALFVQKLNTTKRYGITYGSHGLMSFGSFTKVLLPKIVCLISFIM